MGFKGTEFPWESTNETYKVDQHDLYLVDVHGNNSSVLVAEGETKEIALSNANLAAAAPDLLIALSEIIELEHSEDLNLKFDAMYNAKQAIKKALGNE